MPVGVASAWCGDRNPARPSARKSERTASRPAAHFSAGLLPLKAGIAVLRQTWWLHIMRISSPIAV
jgi:hypothetical protein